MNRLNAVYETRKFKNLYTVILTGLSIFLFIILPFFVTRNFLFGSFWIDLFIRVLITVWSYGNIYFISHLDQFYEKKYKGASKPIFPKPDGLKQFINFLGSIFAGGMAYIFYRAVLKIFLPNMGITGIIISIVLGVFTFLPLLSQYKKR